MVEKCIIPKNKGQNFFVLQGSSSENFRWVLEDCLVSDDSLILDDLKDLTELDYFVSNCQSSSYPRLISYSIIHSFSLDYDLDG